MFSVGNQTQAQDLITCFSRAPTRLTHVCYRKTGLHDELFLLIMVLTGQNGNQVLLTIVMIFDSFLQHLHRIIYFEASILQTESSTVTESIFNKTESINTSANQQTSGGTSTTSSLLIGVLVLLLVIAGTLIYALRK